VDKFRLSLEIDYPVIPFPRENDVTIMSIAVSQGLRGDDLLSVKRCRLSSYSIFLSDIASANGRHVDSMRGLPGADYRLFSTYTHPWSVPLIMIGLCGNRCGDNTVLPMDLYLVLSAVQR
jgi:hypothetical protein